MEIKIGKLDQTVSVNVDALPAVSVQYIVAYGLTQCLNDAHASVARKAFASESEFEDAVMAKVGKRLDQITSGDVPGTRTSKPKQTAAELFAAMSPAERNAVLAEYAAVQADAEAA